MKHAVGVDFSNTIFPMSEAKRALIERRVGGRIQPPLGRKLDRRSVVGSLRVGNDPFTDDHYNAVMSELWSRLDSFEPHPGSMQALRHLATRFDGDVFVLTEVQPETTSLVAEYLAKHLHGSKVNILNGPKLTMAWSCNVYIDNDLGVLSRLADERRLLIHLTPNGQCVSDTAPGVVSLSSWSSVLKRIHAHGFIRNAA